ncbi:restriction endonuclease subunit M [Caldinitratiruptor microaerophilus]|uniref:site-specific DNA-methyltransferase (adenine-specific) n=1 Tax=Caldinitratiruptor microaerophilus TaxID=671077 RepID=A0AA35CJX5_9FIRM|nr:restriction endonuclease subunit M [Caldinitratiruptor microaerophilus]
MPFYTPLRYPGGKGRLGPWLGELMRYNRISGGWYVEPYAGGAGAAIYLLLEGYVDHIVINDVDPFVHAFWWAVLNDTEELLRLVAETPVNLGTWYLQKQVLASPEAYSTTQVGFATFFLNRTNRSGILSGGVIGGQTQAGKYRLDARYNKRELAKRIRRIAARRRHISLYCEDAVQLIEGLQSDLPAKTLLYLDPPYYSKGSQLYRNFYNSEDHTKISKVVSQLRHPWLVTYDDCDFIRGLYQGFPSVTFSLYYSTHLSRPKATEVMFYGNLILHRAPTLRR